MKTKKEDTKQDKFTCNICKKKTYKIYVISVKNKEEDYICEKCYFEMVNIKE